MKKRISLIAFACALFLSAAANASAQTLINELNINPPGTDNPCEYVEIRGTAGAALTNTYLVVIEGDGLPSGTADFVVNLGSQTIGSNGLLVITSPTACPGRTISAGTTVVTDSQLDNSGGGIENGTNTFLLVTSATPIVEGTDYDADNNGTLELLPAGATVLDAIGVTDGDFGDIVYFGQVVTQSTGAAPNALTRFLGNNTPISAAAFYGGFLDTAGGNSTNTYSMTGLTANFPTGGVLTPGAANVGTFAPKDVPVDFNGDGRSDYAVTGTFRGGSTGQEKVWYIQPNGAAASASYQAQWGLFSDRNVPEDYDGDGRDDIAVWRENVNGRGFFYILRSSNNTAQVEQFGAPGDDPSIIGDYDGDNKADVAVFRRGVPGSLIIPCGPHNTWFYRPSASPGVDFRYICWGLPEDRTAPGDYDGDNKTDAAVFRPSQGIFYVNRSSGGTESVYWGASGDTPLRGDYDGDGRDDYALLRINNNSLQFLIRTQTGATQNYQFGLSSDVPVPADYTGDGKTDIAVWRPSEGRFYVRPAQTSGTADFSFKWGQQGDIPAATFLFTVAAD